MPPLRTDEMIRERIEDIDNHGENLTAWEIDFIAHLIDENYSVFSSGQIKVIDRIFHKKVSAEFKQA